MATESDTSAPGLGSTLAAASGGVLGAGARWAVGELLADAGSTGLPWATLTVNVVGCLLVGVIAARVERGSITWTLLVTGVLGGFTTMSAFAVELNRFADDGRPATIVVYLVLTFAGGLGALLLGEQAGARRTRERE